MSPAKKAIVSGSQDEMTRNGRIAHGINAREYAGLKI